MTENEGLIERLEKATELDHQLLYDIATTIYPAAFPCGWILDKDLADWRFLTLDRLVGAKAWESAALALVERVRPGCGWAAGKSPSGIGWARCFVPGRQEHYAEAGTPAIALCLALLRALETSNV